MGQFPKGRETKKHETKGKTMYNDHYEDYLVYGEPVEPYRYDSENECKDRDSED